jgi:hypothetical protein
MAVLTGTCAEAEILSTSSKKRAIRKYFFIKNDCPDSNRPRSQKPKSALANFALNI